MPLDDMFGSIIAAAFAPDQTAVDVDRFMSSVTPLLANVIEPAMDVMKSFNLQRNSLSINDRLFLGRIQFSMPYINWYRVALNDGHGTWPCALHLDGTSPGIIGPRSTAVVPPDTKVLVYLPPNGLIGYIVAVLPEIITDGNVVFPDFTSQGSNIGIKRCQYYYQYMTQLADEGGALDFSNSRPLDGTVFDWGVMAETGVGLHVDPELAYLRVAENCGVFAFYHDNFLRVTGFNTEFVSSAHKYEYREDEGEHRITHNEAFYPWEARGAYGFEAQVFRTNTDEAVHYDKPEGKFEPLFDDQQSFYRYREHGGYTGQGRIREMVLPPDGAVGGSQINRYSSTDNYIGVFREQIGIDGLWTVETAKGLVLAKRSLVVAEKEVRPCDDYSSNCDSKENDNYKFSGQFGGGREHKVGDIANPAGDNAQLMSACGVLDAHSQYFNWRSVHPFAYHEKDYRLPEESEHKLTKNQDGPNFSQLLTRTWIKRPEAKKMTVDERYGETEYWELYSHLTFTEDGGVVIHGGNGEELRMVGGNIVLSCPGNIFLQSGKSLVALAGDDINLRAHNSFDLSANKKDGRIKAGINLHMLSGNSGEGGTLIENRSLTDYQIYPDAGGEDVRSSGIVLKANNSQVVANAKDIYLRTGNPDGGVASGDIVLDAARGTANIVTVSNEFRRFIQTEARDAFGFPNVRAINTFSQADCMLNARLQVRGGIDARGAIRCRDGITIASGHIQSLAGGDVTRLANPAEIREYLEDIQKLQETETSTARGNYSGTFTEQLYRADAIGNAETQQQIAFSFRNEKQYATSSNFSLPETHYQILARVNSAGTKVWEEEPVKYRNRETMPWPGTRKWRDEQTLLTLPPDEFKMYDLSASQAKPREHGNATYEEPTYGNFQTQYPQEQYRIMDIGDE